MRQNHCGLWSIVLWLWTCGGSSWIEGVTDKNSWPHAGMGQKRRSQDAYPCGKPSQTTFQYHYTVNLALNTLTFGDTVSSNYSRSRQTHSCSAGGFCSWLCSYFKVADMLLCFFFPIEKCELYLKTRFQSSETSLNTRKIDYFRINTCKHWMNSPICYLYINFFICV